MSILDSDIGLWENHTIKERAPDGSIKATLADDAYPAGWTDNIITGRLVGDNPRQLIVSWHKYVSGRIHAWENSQEVAALKRAEASRTSSGGKDAAPEQSAGRGEATANHLPDGEASLEAILESQISTLSRSVARIEEEIASKTASLVLVRERLSKAERALGAIYDTGDSGKRGSEVHTGNSGSVPRGNTATDTPYGAGSSGFGRVPSRRGRPVGSRDSKPRIRASNKGIPAGQPELDRVQEQEHPDSGG